MTSIQQPTIPSFARIQPEEATPATAAVTTPKSAPPLKFAAENEFMHTLRKRIDALFEGTGRRKRDCWQMYVKSAVLMTAFVTSYLALLFVVTTWWQAVPIAAFLGLVLAGIGFNIGHDGGHNGYSEKGWINKIAAMSFDLIGGSSFQWHWKHGVFHHTYVNISGHDTDIETGILGRLSPQQPRYWFHRFQHIYLWPLYGMLAMKWQIFDDWNDIIRGRIGEHKVRRPRGKDLFIFVAGKLVAYTFMFVIPMLLHPVLSVLGLYVVAMFCMGVAMSVVFQLAHVVEDAEFPMPVGDTNKMENAWAVHQIETTVDFARDSKICSWLMGGLNFQIEHHLFPKICHINYPEMSKVVEQTCKEFGVRFSEHKTFRSGVASHYRWLKKMGQPEVTPAM
ncbi:fatty acid desaturase family protein [Humisphaera borealis]|nr:acyl-CoA desaturase [Humisphaera borealis]